MTPTISSKVSRRSALRFFGASAAVAATAPTLSAPASAATPLADPAASNFWRSVSRQFVLDKDILFMNVGTVGSPPRRVLKNMADNAERVAREATSSYSDFAHVREVVGRAYGVDTDEIAIPHNTSDAMSKVLAGLNLKPDDEVLTTNHEHSGGNSPLAVLRDRHGVKIVRVALPIGDDQRAEDYVELFRQAITSRTKLIMFSAPVYVTGTMLPIRMLAELAQDHGIPTLVDGAHIPGMMAYDFRELGIDFLAGAGAKWQCGPGGTGVLYIRNKVTGSNPNPLPEFWPTITSAYPDEGLPARTSGGTASYDMGRLVQYCGNGSLVLNEGFLEANQMWDEIGRKRIEDYTVGLAAYLKESIAERWGAAALYSPMTDTRLTCALTGFNPFQSSADVYDAAKSSQFVERLLAEHGVEIRNTSVAVPGEPAHRPVRVSTHLFHSREDVDRLVSAAWKLSRDMA